MHDYRISGLRVSSEVALPGLIGAPEGDARADVTIGLGPVPLALDQPETVSATYQIAGELFLLRIPHIARFLLRAGREIIVEVEDGTPIEDVAIFISGTVFGVLLHQRGQIVLHASAVRVGGKAVLFCGQSGAGKSTMAAALGQRGYAMVSDDACSIALDADGVARVHSDGRQFKLWRQAIDRLGLDGHRGAPVRSTLNKFYVNLAAAEYEPLAIGAIYVLRETRPPMTDGFVEPNFVDAARAFRRNAYRPRLIDTLHQQGAYLAAGAAICTKSQFYFFNRPLDFAALPATLDRIEEHWRATGLLGAPA